MLSPTIALFMIMAPGASPDVGHRAELIAAPPALRFVVKDQLWSCTDTQCSAPSSASRPEIACAALARKAGRLASFSADGRPLPPEALERCNKAAR